ncbi:MAG: glycerol-3-phosphate 1-O-acyltransferase PlsY [Gammaproteobacteria bacterium]|nr:glycerol-3-phosphate 1-O-acyltransferase PlsY [Gammaproteobacteria bacterium]
MGLEEISFTGLLLIGFGYLLGSVSSAVLVSRMFGITDPRAAGSKNPGATNVLRIGGKKAAFLTLLGDSLKGIIPLILCYQLNQSHWTLGFVAMAAFFGHLFPIFFHFKGGKGVATFFGVLFLLEWQLGVYAALTWLVCLWAFKISSLSALITAITVPFFAWFYFPHYFMILLIICLFLVLRHHQNIRNLMGGNEHSISQHKARS